MIVVAGEGMNNLADVMMLNLDSMHWYEPPIDFNDCTFSPRKFHTVTAIPPTLESETY